MAPRQASPLTLSAPHLEHLDKSPLVLADSSRTTSAESAGPGKSKGTVTLSLDQKRILAASQQVAANASTSRAAMTIMARSMDKENTKNLPVVLPASVHFPVQGAVPVVFTANLSDAISSSCSSTQEAKHEHEDERPGEEDQILQAYLDLTSSKLYGQDHDPLDLTVKQQLLQRMSKLEKHQEMQKIKSEQFHKRIQQEKLNMSARQQSRLEKVRALEDIISATQNRCDMSLINEQLTRNILENNNSSSSLSSSQPQLIGDDVGASRLLSESSQRFTRPEKENVETESNKNMEALLAQLSILKSQVVQLEKENNARAGTIHSLREQNQAIIQELHAVHSQKTEIENTFHDKFVALSKDRHELIYRLIEMEKRVVDVESTREAGTSLHLAPCTANVGSHGVSTVAAPRSDVNGIEDRMTVNSSNDSDDAQLQIATLLQKLQEFERRRHILETTKEALETSLMEANENRRDVENSLVAVTEDLVIVRADNTTLSEELDSMKEDANHLSGQRILLLEELDKTSSRLNSILHHRNQLELENSSLHQSRDNQEDELTENMAFFTSQHKAMASVIHRLQEIRLVTSHQEDLVDVEETSSHDSYNHNYKEKSCRQAVANSQWLDSALVEMDEIAASLTSCLAGLNVKIRPFEADECKEATAKGSWNFSIRGLFGRRADGSSSSTSTQGKTTDSQSPISDAIANIED